MIAASVLVQVRRKSQSYCCSTNRSITSTIIASTTRTTKKNHRESSSLLLQSTSSSPKIVRLLSSTASSSPNSNSNNHYNNPNGINIKYESHEYPWATEPPIITRTTAKEAMEQLQLKQLEKISSKTSTQDTTDDTASVTSSSSSSSSSNTTTSSSSTKDDTNNSSSLWSMMTNFVTNIFSPPSTASSSNSSIMSSFSSIAIKEPSSTSSVSKSSSNFIEYDDPFDDKGLIPIEQVEQIRQQQRKELEQIPISLQPVTKQIPSYVPIHNQNTIRPIPETIISTLSNGMRIVSQETYGHVSTIGIVSMMGSRYETKQNSGVTNILELLSFGSSRLYIDQNHVNQQLQQWLGNRFAHTGREQSMYGIDVLRTNVNVACEMLAEIILYPQYTYNEIEHAKETLHYVLTHDDIPPEFIMSEAIQEAAFGFDQQLGQPHGCPIPNLYNIDRNMIMKWWDEKIIYNPNNMVLGGAGIEHDLLHQLGEQHFGHLQQKTITIPITTTDNNNNNTTQLQQQQQKLAHQFVPSIYRGGSKVISLPEPIDGSDQLTPDQFSVVHREKRLTRVALGIEIGGWHSPNLVAICVLQTLLGGGSSFSAGGPGKGMYSRLYRQILNRYHWAESAEAFTSFHNEAGLMGITGRCEPKYVADMVKTFCIHLKRLAIEPVSEEELDRARNMLRNDVMTQLESRFVLFEDMSRQVLTFNKREHISETVAKIDAITAQDIQLIIAQAIVKPPTFTALGVNVLYVPPYEQVCEWLNR